MKKSVFLPTSFARRWMLSSTVCGALLLCAGAAHAQPLPYQNPQAPLETRVNDLMARLTPNERISLLTGTAFTTQPIARLGIPAMGMVDAGQGVRGGMDSTQGPATAFPSGVAMASTWNPTLVGRTAAAIGVETQNKGTGAQVLLGPAVNIQRSPLGGRNGEYFSEDPYLAARLGVAYIRAMQATGTVACIKHFAANNEEVDRGFINVQVSERALREIYLPAFEAGVKEGGVWTVMSSYNRLNGPHASANEYLLTDILKRCWGFDGMVMSDWGGVHDTPRTIKAGNDLEMPGPGLLAPAKVKVALERGQVTQAQIDENVRRTLRTVLRSGVLNGLKTPNNALVNSDANREVAYQTALESIVLLKNEKSTLPLDATKLRSLALIGPAAREFQIGAGGSPEVRPLRSVGPLAGIQARLGAGVTVRTTSGESSGSAFPAGTITATNGNANAAGFRAEYFANKNLEGAATLTRAEAQVDAPRPPAPLGNDNWSARWTTTLTPRTTGTTTFLFRSDDGCRLFLDGKQIINEWHEGGATTYSAKADLKAGQKYELRAEYYQGGGDSAAQLTWIEPGTQLYADAVNMARQSDVAVVFVTTRGTEGEGQDRPSMALPNDQDELVRRVVAANPKTIVVLNNGTPVLMPWLASVPALVEAWFPGQEGGRALAQILFGDANPSGHLPTTLGARRADYPDAPNFPGTNGKVRYDEGIYVGYRAFDKRNIAPLFPFGYGLSYTTFRIDNLKVSTPSPQAASARPPLSGQFDTTVRVTNTGKRAGAQVVQLYVRDLAPKTDRPLRELKGFTKVFLQPGESRTVSLRLTPHDFAWCDAKAKGWRVNAGDYAIEVGDSSRNLTQRATVRLAASLEPIPFMRDEVEAVAPADDSPDLARGKTVFASSLQEPQYKAELAVDGDEGTRWASGFFDNQWLAVDLGRQQRVGRVHLKWESAYATDYRIEVSDDNQNWKSVYTATQAEGEEEDVTFAPVEARYVRIFCLKRATQFGSSLYSFEVRAPE